MRLRFYYTESKNFLKTIEALRKTASKTLTFKQSKQTNNLFRSVQSKQKCAAL